MKTLKPGCLGCGYEFSSPEEKKSGRCLCDPMRDEADRQAFEHDHRWGAGLSFAPEHRAAREADAFWDYDGGER